MSRPLPPARALAGAALVLGVVLVVVAIVVLSRDPDRLVARGQDALDRHDLAAAEASFRQAVGLEPGHVQALAGLGWTYLIAGQQGAAEAAFDRCAEVAPDHAECLRGQASVALRKGLQEQGRALLVRALEQSPDDPRVQSSLALLDLGEGDVETAAGRYERLVARYPDDPEYKLGLVEARLRQDRVDEARSLAADALASPGLPVRTEAMLHLVHARALVKAVSGRWDPARCAETVPPVLAWLDAADREVDAAEATGANPPQLGEVRRLVGRMRGQVQDDCPAGELRVAAPTAVEER